MTNRLFDSSVGRLAVAGIVILPYLFLLARYVDYDLEYVKAVVCSGANLNQTTITGIEVGQERGYVRPNKIFGHIHIAKTGG